MARKSYSRRRAGRVDGGAAWISYSDMMAALLLMFVLILCYSVYQYFVMLETKTQELQAQGTVLVSQQGMLSQQELQISEKQAALDTALAEITVQKTQMDTQAAALDAQQVIIQQAQTDVKTKEDALTLAQGQLVAAQIELAQQQTQLTTATAQLETQQIAMATQQQKLDDLVGVRTKIIRELSGGLAAANLKAAVDPNTGDIMMESSVLFDVGKYEIKAGGKKVLDEFIPLYLSVLLSDDYVAYLGEIVIEGHTDTQGTYLSNLKLSQDRALAVATYCLGLKGLNAQQQEKLRQVLTAKGRSYTDAILLEDGGVNMEMSRRVEFKFRLKDSEMIDEMRQILSVGGSQ